MNLVESLNGYFKCLFQAHGLLKYTDTEGYCHWLTLNISSFLSNAILAAMSKAFKKSMKMSGIFFSRWWNFYMFENWKCQGREIHYFFIKNIKNEQLWRFFSKGYAIAKQLFWEIWDGDWYSISKIT